MSDYVPVDFAAYSIADESRQVEKIPQDKFDEKVNEKEKLWRISSLLASVDDDTQILVLPQAESKREVKIIDTKY